MSKQVLAGGAEVAIEWHGHPARAWMPLPLAARDLSLGVDPVRATERAAAEVRRVGDRLPGGWEPLARLLLRAEGIASSNIEGLHAPVAAVVAAEAGDPSAVPPAPSVADNLGVVGHVLAHARGAAPVTVDDLHRWHAELMRHGGLPPHLVGAFRDTQGWIGGRGPQDAAYVPPPADAVPGLVDDLLEHLAAPPADPVAHAAVVHAQFETIHPYGDGNGRLGRLLVLWVLARRLAVAVPPPVSVLIARDPGGYLSGLHWFRVGELTPWVEWFAGVVAQAALSSLGLGRRGRRAARGLARPHRRPPRRRRRAPRPRRAAVASDAVGRHRCVARRHLADRGAHRARRAHDTRHPRGATRDALGSWDAPGAGGSPAASSTSSAAGPADDARRLA